jgi:hypothetical protein
MRPEITEEQKRTIEQGFKRARVHVKRGEVTLSFSPEGKIGNIKIITNH